MDTETLPNFLLARIAEDEAVARARGQTSSEGVRGRPWVKPTPARVLAECAAKRRIVEHHTATPARRHPGYDCKWCGMTWPCFDLRNLAPPYADHPDCRPEWLP